MDPWGAADSAIAYGAVFESMAASDAYDVLVLVHDFPYRSMAAEVATANEVTGQLLGATRARPHILPIYVSLTSGEPPPETKALLDEQGGGAPLLRGALEAFSAIASVARWEQARIRRLASGPWRPAWPALAADRTAYGLEPTATTATADPAVATTVTAPRALSEGDSLELLRAEGLAVTAAVAVPDAGAAVDAARALAPSAVVLKVDAADVPHKSELGLVRLALLGDDAIRAAAQELLATARGLGLAAAGLLVQPMADPGVELIVGLRRDASFGPAVVVGLGGLLTEVLDDVAIRLAPVDHATALTMLAELRGAQILDGVRGARPVDRGAVAELIVGLARLGEARPDIVEVDLNPVIASATSARAVDALVVLGATPELPTHA